MKPHACACCLWFPGTVVRRSFAGCLPSAAAVWFVCLLTVIVWCVSQSVTRRSYGGVRL